MNRRQALFAIGAAAGGLTTVAANGALLAEHGAADGGDHWDKCAQACDACRHDCNRGFRHCLEKLAAGGKDYAEQLKLCVDCAEMCGDCAQLCGRHSPLTAPVCEACVACCDACAAECQKHKGDGVMQEIEKSCRECAAICREMLTHLRH